MSEPTWETMSILEKLQRTEKRLTELTTAVQSSPPLLDFAAHSNRMRIIEMDVRTLRSELEKKKPTEYQAFADLWDKATETERAGIAQMVTGRTSSQPVTPEGPVS